MGTVKVLCAGGAAGDVSSSGLSTPTPGDGAGAAQGLGWAGGHGVG